MGLDEQIARLEQRARDTLAREWNDWRWDYWLRVSWRHRVGATTANTHLEQLIRDLQGRGSPTIHVVAGFHGDDPANPHAHVLVHLSRRVRMRFLNANEFRDWFAAYWRHGECWAAVFDPTRRESGGAVTYLARDPGTVVWG